MRGVRVALGAAITGMLLAAGPALAAPAWHGSYLEGADEVSTFAAGEFGCGVPYAGSMHEVRHGSYDLLVPGTGPRSSELKVLGSVDGYLEITPEHPGDGPSYTGSYREHVAGWFASLDPDVFRVGHFRLLGTLEGSDGSTKRWVMSLKVTLRADGTTVVDRLIESCA